MIELKKINIAFGKKECIKNGNFIAYPHQITGICGESGTGKTSLLYLIGMISNHEHTYLYNNEILNLNNLEKENFRNNHVSFITQNNLLIETICVEKNIEFFIESFNSSLTTDQILEMVKMTGKRFAMPNSLSGGEKQRVAIACAIAKNSDIILGDEITSSLDESNKKIIMDLMRECVNNGKTVILVSHEQEILEQCNRVYRIDHIELNLEKEMNVDSVSIGQEDVIEKKATLKIFELLFHSNRKNNWKRIFISFVIMIMLFLSASLLRQSSLSINQESFSVENVTNTKVLALCDESKEYSTTNYGYAIRDINRWEPLSESANKKLEKLDHIEKIYNYYTFGYSMLGKDGRSKNMTIKVTREGKTIEKRAPSEEDVMIGTDNPFSVIPFYPEENFKQNENIYINSNMAYYYNIKVGDTVELMINVPFAMAKSVESQSLSESEDAKNSYYPVECIGEQVLVKKKVEGIIESNSIFSNEIYMQYENMHDMLSNQVEKYEKGQIEINEGAYEGYSQIEELRPYAKAIFVDKVENVLRIKKEINAISDTLYAYNEYQSILELQEENNKLNNDMLKVTYIGVTTFIIGAVIVEILYLRKYKSTYLIMNLIGYDRKEKNKIFVFHFLWQSMVIVCVSLFVYISASIPLIMALINHENKIFQYQYFPEIYLKYVGLAEFSLMHFIVFLISVIIVIGAVSIGMKKYFDKQDLITWVRGK